MVANNELGVEVTLSLSDMKKVLGDGKIKELVEQCAETASGSGDVGSCVEDALLERLTEMFEEPNEESNEEPLQPVPMADWIKNDPNPGDDEICRPCALPITVRWYRDELTNIGRKDLAARLVEIGLGANPLTTAEELDNIKNVVGAKERARLLDFDAATQVNNV